jgi:cyclopropane fatty-acyl-phospholipid synthase-like methyltransferase
MKNAIKTGLVSLLKLVPYPLGRQLFRLWLGAIAKKEPKTAMRALLNLDDDVASHVDQVAMRYDQNDTHVKHRLMQYHEFFVERLKPRERVLDIGCGYGAVAWSMVTKANAIVTGIDLNAKNIEMAQRLFQHSHLTFMQGDALQELPPGPFETIVISNTLEHIQDRIEFLKAMEEQVHPRRWLIRVPMINRHWHVPMRRELGMFYFSDRTHYTEYTPQSFEEELKAAGLMIIHMQINWGEIWAEATSNA